jgi:hypothetical protein
MNLKQIVDSSWNKMKIGTATALAATALFMPAKTEAAKPRLDMNITLGPDYSHSDIEQVMLPDWRDNFRYKQYIAVGTHEYDWSASLNLGLGLEPKLVFDNGWQIGFPVSYNFRTPAFNGVPCPSSKTVAQTTTDFWDEIPVLAVQLDKKNPSYGISIRKNAWEVQFSTQEYKIYLQDYRGVDVYGARNYSKSIGKRDVIEEGWTQRIDMFYHFYEDEYKHKWNKETKKYEIYEVRGDDSGLSLGLFYEKDGDNTWMAGINAKLSFDTLKFFKGGDKK